MDAIGDCTWFITDDGSPLPQLAEAAIQTAECAAHNITAEIRGARKKEYKPKIHGTVMSIGGKYAVADIVSYPLGRFTLSGRLAMLLKHLLNIWLAFGYIRSRLFTSRNRPF